MPARFHVIIPPRPLRELVEICAYIEPHSAQNAASVAQMLVSSIDSLEILPHRFNIHEHRRDPAKTVRSMPVPPFVVYYRIDDLRRSVRILSIRHGARRKPKRFP